MINLEQLDDKVEKVLETQSVSWAQRVMQSRSGLWIIAMISFVESALPLPLLTDPFLAAGILLNRQKTFYITLLATFASVLGGLFAYASAVLFFEVIMSSLSSEMVSQLHTIISNSESNTFVFTIVGAVTPVPYTLVAWAMAVIEGSLLMFIVASIIGRGFRYAVVGYCTYKFGPAAMKYARKYLTVTSVILIALAILFVIVKM